MRAFGLAALPALALLLTACTTPAGDIGIELKGEHIHAVVATCPGHSIEHFHLSEDGGPFEDEWDIAPGRTSSDLGVFDDAVTATDTGHTYTLSASSSTTSDWITGLTFTSEDLAALDDGWVMVDDALDQYRVGFVSKEVFDSLDGVC